MYQSPQYNFINEGLCDDNMDDMSDTDGSPQVYDDYYVNHQTELTPIRPVVKRRRPASYHPYSIPSYPRSSWPHNASYKHMTQGDDSVAFQGGYCATSSSGHSNDQATLKKMMEAIEKISERISHIEEKISSTNSSSSGYSENEVKSRIPPQLSVSIFIL